MADLSAYPELMAQQQDIARRQQLAQALSGQSMQPLQGTQAGRYYVSPGIAQGVAKLAQAYLGGNVAAGVDQEQATLGQRVQAERGARLAQALQASQAQPEVPQPAPEFGGGPARPAQPADPLRGMQMLAQTQDPTLIQMGQPVFAAQQKAVEADEGRQFRAAEAERARTSQEQLRRDLASQADTLRRDLAGNRPPEPVTPVEIMRDGKIIKVDARTGRVIGDSPTKPPQVDKKDLETYKAGLKDLQRDESALANITQTENALKRWAELNANVETGPIAGRRPISFNPEFQEIQQLQNYLAVNNFKPGQGQISNFERELIKGAGPSALNDRETNNRIIQIQLGAVQNARDRGAFREWYLEKNGKLLGADKEWNEYIENNPRFKKGETQGSVVANEDRQDWLTYFSAGRRSGDSKAPAVGSVVDGYEFLGGNPSDRKNWKKK